MASRLRPLNMEKAMSATMSTMVIALATTNSTMVKAARRRFLLDVVLQSIFGEEGLH